MAENADEKMFNERVRSTDGSKCPVVGLTGTGGAGKSSLTDELMLRIQRDNPGTKIALLATDPTRKRTGGALLGDRIRMNFQMRTYSCVHLPVEIAVERLQIV